MFLMIGGFLLTTLLGYVVYVVTSVADNDPNDTDIDAYIIESEHNDKFIKVNCDKHHYSKTYDKPGRQLLILYGTEYGFSEEIAKKLFDQISNHADEDQCPWQPRLLDVKYHTLIDFHQEYLTFIVISTAGDGIPPTEARPFCNWLNECQDHFGQMSFSVLALGDTNYPHFCRTGRQVDQRFQELDCHRIVPRHDVDMEDWEVINKWLHLAQICLDTAHVEPCLDYLDIQQTQENDTEPSRSKPFMARMTVNRPLTVCVTGDDKETIHCEFDLSGSDITWTSGDALGIFPLNNPPEVEVLLQAMGCKGTEQVHVPKWAFHPKPEGPIGLQFALSKYYDLKMVRPELLQCLQNAMTGTESNKYKLDELLKDGISKKNTKLHAYLDQSEVADVLNEFKTSTSVLLCDDILQHMKGLQPRYYSIASSPTIRSDSCCVTVAVVRYKTLGLSRTGVTTTFLQDRLATGDTCPVFISHNPEFRLPSDTNLPIIMVGPGTGIAPFMAFITERLDSEATGNNLLYFGCRHKKRDFLHRTELEKWSVSGQIKLRTAFSRGQPHKIYVQDLIREDGDLIWRLIEEQGAHIYVCGDAKHMAHDVHQELVSIVESRGNLSTTEAELRLQSLESCGRYQKDVWVT